MTPCIKRRLLHIAELTYFNPLANTGRFAAIGWEGQPSIIRREPDVAVVGRIDSGVVIAFRGTRAPLNPNDDDAWATFLDWMNNANALTRDNPIYRGAVHSGFARSVDCLWRANDGGPGIEATVETLFADGAPRRLFITGHSKGGALANLAAWRAKQKWPELPLRVVTFAAARAGDAEFRAAYEAAGIRCTRYEVRADLVPNLPPGEGTPPLALRLLERLPFAESRNLGYVGIGERVIGGGSWLQSVLGGLRSVFGGGRLAGLMPVWVRAHLITPDSQYDQLICPRGEPGCGHA